MTDRVVRPLEPSEIRAADRLFGDTLHLRHTQEDDWERASRGFQPGRTLGAFDGGTLIGTSRSMDAALTVPGGARIETAAVTGVGVRADRTRKGVLRDLMRTQLAEVAERGVPTATLHASEAMIYGRFGYGVATTGRTLRIKRRKARVRDQAPTGGEIELLDLESAIRDLPTWYPLFVGLRNGMLTRPSFLWAGWEGHYRRSDGVAHLVVHRGPDGVDGYASYRVARDAGTTVMHVEDMNTASDEAFADLWRFLVGVDLVDRIDVPCRPVDEPLETLFTDPRACSVTWLGDDLWLRLVDVRAALSARTYAGDGQVVLEVRDALLPQNSGRYVVSAAGATTTDRSAALRIDVDTAAMLYLGTWRPSALVAAGRVEVIDPQAVKALDRLLATATQPWCGTFF
ncbi:MAG: GNAT family N-acetyltransferase [Haloechinothrix sp.]